MRVNTYFLITGFKQVSERDGKGRFVKGASGNSGGRPAVIVKVRELARQYTTDAIQTLVGIMKDPEGDTGPRVRAAEAILDRAWGKATQPLDHQGEAFSLVLHLGGKPLDNDHG